jgi:hypothetical protein
MSKKFDKRIAFVRSALNLKLTDNVKLANEWYVANGCAKLDNTEALRRFAAWLI